MDLQQVLDFVEGYSVGLVQITGGEPLLQEQVYPLMQQLLHRGRLVLLETNGSISLKDVPAGVIKIMDVKCPGSGMADTLHLANVRLLEPSDEVKFVLSSEADYTWATRFIKTHILNSDIAGELQKRPTILFSPIQPHLPPSDLASWLLRDQLPVKLQLQLHTQLWPGETRGV